MIDIQKYYDKYGKSSVLLGWGIVTLLAVTFALWGTIDYSFVCISFIGWGVLALYYLLEWKKNKNDNNECSILALKFSSDITNRRVRYVLHILYLLILICLLAIIWITEVRSSLYFLLVICLTVIIVLSIFTSHSKMGTTLNIVKILSLSLLTSLAYFKFFYWGSNDSWEHAFYNTLIRLTGEANVAQLGKEVAYPIQHIAVSIMDLLSFSTGDIRLSTILAVALPSILLSILVYQVARKIFGVEFALLSLVIFNLSFSTIKWRVWGSTTTYALVLFIVISFIIFELLVSNKKKNKYQYIFLLLLLFLTINLTHLFSVFMIFFVMMGTYMACILIEKRWINSATPLLVFYMVISLFYWIAQNYGLSFVTIFVDMGLKSDAALVANPLTYINIAPPSLIELLLRENPLTIVLLIIQLLLCLCLATTYGKNTQLRIDQNNMWYFILPCLTLSLLYLLVNMLFSSLSIRFAPYILYFSSILSAFCIYNYACAPKTGKRLPKIITIMIIILVIVMLVFVNISHPVINDDNHLYLKNTYPVDSFTLSEVVGVKSLINIIPDGQTIQRDSVIQDVVGYFYSLKLYDMQNTIPKYSNDIGVQADWSNLTNEKSQLIMFRNALLKSIIFIDMTAYDVTGRGNNKKVIQLNQDYLDMLNAKSSRYYDNHAICGFILDKDQVIIM